MVPGTRYALHQITKRVDGSIPNVQAALADCVARGVLRKAMSGKRAVYWVPTEEEIQNEQPDAKRYASPQATLQGYEATMRRFQDLCMATRPPRPAGQTIRSVIGPMQKAPVRPDEADA
ncbi:hypothetical protein [Paraburkholderia tuberum]|nr:hypothetical protein [Paraburkholderia tuberum]